ncbi:hypothetical protein M427DRAFT_134769 [Gonapodya prolifera JEL478]|uniref:Uncharacterized protein n=1 Tax=Gonapodya prolifera (strain JEL478) TaxID=1344416 RepID=A0A139AGQ7_GONPJ|nr:hypothetical protein M427DRAFT_134769 [Gonapodya prolifera JEL478]|eukprot:KXS15986.1 hypothetical protein M427DRAFT_134769 [Gonapodya prolifera JEL478]
MVYRMGGSMRDADNGSPFSRLWTLGMPECLRAGFATLILDIHRAENAAREKMSSFLKATAAVQPGGIQSVFGLKRAIALRQSVPSDTKKLKLTKAHPLVELFVAAWQQPYQFTERKPNILCDVLLAFLEGRAATSIKDSTALCKPLRILQHEVAFLVITLHPYESLLATSLLHLRIRMEGIWLDEPGMLLVNLAIHAPLLFTFRMKKTLYPRPLPTVYVPSFVSCVVRG